MGTAVGQRRMKRLPGVEAEVPDGGRGVNVHEHANKDDLDTLGPDTDYVLADGTRAVQYSSGYFAIGNVSGGNYVKVESDGTLVFVGAGTVWDDLRVSAETTKVGASAPDFDTFLSGTKIYWFDAGTDQEVHFSVQMPHGWAGTGIVPHVHWVPKTTADGAPANQVVRWGLEYTWTDRHEVFPGTLTVYATVHSPADANVVASKHYSTDFAEIVPSATQDGISSMLVCRLFRDANDAADTYEADAGLLEIDFHYEIDTVGSRLVGTK